MVMFSFQSGYEKGGKDMTIYLGDFQFGVGILGGVETICMQFVDLLRYMGKH